MLLFYWIIFDEAFMTTYESKRYAKLKVGHDFHISVKHFCKYSHFYYSDMLKSLHNEYWEINSHNHNYLECNSNSKNRFASIHKYIDFTW